VRLRNAWRRRKSRIYFLRRFFDYSRFDEVRNYLDGFPNSFLIGRNSMHRYNNQDHSMLTAIEAVDNIIAGHS
jgi:hypothetical protein